MDFISFLTFKHLHSELGQLLGSESSLPTIVPVNLCYDYNHIEFSTNLHKQAMAKDNLKWQAALPFFLTLITLKLHLKPHANWIFHFSGFHISIIQNQKFRASPERLKLKPVLEVKLLFLHWPQFIFFYGWNKTHEAKLHTLASNTEWT